MLLNLDDVKTKIQAGSNLLLAGDENLLAQLPSGNWIGGTIPYFMAAEGGTISKEKIFATELPEAFSLADICFFDSATIDQIAKNGPDNGCAFVIIPANSQIHLQYAQEASNYEDMFLKPIIGWISGMHLDDTDVTPKVFSGKNAEISDSKAVVMYTQLPPEYIAQIGIVNLFSQGDGDTITFNETGFSATECSINGETRNFAEYLLTNNVPTENPLVADYFGAQINVSFKAVNEDDKSVDFYAPVFSGIQYKLAKPITNYVSEFESAISKVQTEIAFSCNCILNFLFSELEGKKTGQIVGPITFGEIAFQLLNQTMVYLTLHKQ